LDGVRVWTAGWFGFGQRRDVIGWYKNMALVDFCFRLENVVFPKVSYEGIELRNCAHGRR
jgi:hypothetical protein